MIAVGNPLVAARFLTRIPIPGGRSDSGKMLADSLTFFPLVGLALGGLLAVVDLLLRQAFAPPVVNALLLVTLAGVTGCFHLDGLADSADGLLCHATRERRLEIMRDSHVGAFGVVALVLVLLLQYSALAALPDTIRWQALLLMGLCSRWSILMLAALFPYARESGTGKAIREGATPSRVAVSSLLAATCALAVSGPGGLLPWAIVAALLVAFGAVASGRLGGLSGDVYGAGVTISESASLIAAPVFLSAGVWWLP